MTGPIALAILIVIVVWWYKYPAHMRAVGQFVRSASAARTATPTPARRNRLAINAVLILAAAAILYFGGVHPIDWRTPGFGQVNKLVWENWLVVLLLFGILAVAIAYNASAPTSKKLLNVLLWVAAFLFIGTWLLDWGGRQFVASPQVATASPTRICPNVSSHATASCLITNSSWSNWFQFADGARDNGMQVCASRGMQYQRKEDDGVTFWRLKANNGNMVAQYRLFPADVTCSEVF